jgi:hypothetical protein
MDFSSTLIIIIVLLVTCIVLGVWYSRQTGAKKEARKILAAGHITNQHHFNRTLRLLTGMKTDLEAADLRQQLLALEQKTGAAPDKQRPA